jgi:3'-phosphoadenosine 5'-phosphosulfate sulfotransferase (PAPS reductase)/FAD synthetase
VSGATSAAVASLTRPQRERRVVELVEQAHRIVDDALDEHLNGRTLHATCVLFSGGNDSTVLAHLMRERATHAIHANTTIGIEATRVFVRNTCEEWGLPLVEERGPDTYRDLVLGLVTTKAGERVWPGGFPGPGAHGLMYQRLKERALDKARHTIGIANSRKNAALFLAGRRREESKRREDVPLHEPDGSVIWASPLAMWTKADLTTYRLMAGDVPTNEVSDLIHMSGECLCGAFAHPGELEEIRFWYPEVAAEIDALEAEVRAAGITSGPRETWGHGQGRASSSGRLCQSCDSRFAPQEPLFGGVA